MKKRLLLSLAAMLITLGAAAQETAGRRLSIEQIAKMYSARDGFSTTVVKGDITNGIMGSLDIESVDISKIIKDISSIVVVRATRPDEGFAREVDYAVAEGYSTVLATSSEGERVRFLLSEGAAGGESEFVIAIFGPETNIVVSIVGDYTLGKVSKQQ